MVQSAIRRGQLGQALQFMCCVRTALIHILQNKRGQSLRARLLQRPFFSQRLFNSLQ